MSPGKNKDTWQEQVFTLTSEELWWTSKQIRKSVKLADMGTVAEWSDIGIGHAFEIITRVKDGKVYKFSAVDDADRDAWLVALRSKTQIRSVGELEELDQSADGKRADFFVRLNVNVIVVVVGCVLACVTIIGFCLIFNQSPASPTGPSPAASKPHGESGSASDSNATTAQGYGYGYGYGEGCKSETCEDMSASCLDSYSEKIFTSCQQIKDRGLCGFVDAKELCCKTCGPCGERCNGFESNFGVTDDPWNHTTCTESANQAFEGSSATCAELLVPRRSQAVSCDDVRRPGTKHCETYSQYWVNISGGSSKPESVYPASANRRMTGIIIPNKTMPKGGWPWLLHFSFMLANGEPTAGFDGRSFSGLTDQNLSLGSYDVWYGRHNHQKALKGFVEAGIAVVMVSEYIPDGNFYSEDKMFLDKTNKTCDTSGETRVVWPLAPKV